jgi:pyruvate dehydrogenase phosphatase
MNSQIHFLALHFILTDESCGLDWDTRYKIIKGTCEGLQYLHTGYKDAIYHLDLKPANILLDNNMTPKIGDFGLSRLFASSATYTTKKFIGTL